MSAQFRCAVAFTIVGIFVLVSAHGQPAAAQLPTAEFKCQNTVAKQGRKLFRKTFKALAKCEDKISKGDLPDTTDCTLDVDAAAKISDAELNYAQKLTDFCTDTLGREPSLRCDL